RWGKIDKEHGNLYFPIPRDRDQVFFTNSGLFPGIAARKWAMPKFQGFREEIRDVNGFMFNARYFDRMFLHRLEEEDWNEMASLVQERLTDELLAAAVRRMPDTVYSLSGRELLRILKARRDGLQQDALDYYGFLAKAVDIPGSAQRDYFEVLYQENGNVRVKGSKVKDNGGPGRLFYDRTFRPDITKEIRLYGRDDEDVFSVGGSAGTARQSPMKVRMIGGSGKDVFRLAEDVPAGRKVFIYDRSDRENSYPRPGKARLRTAENEAVNEYDPRSFRYHRLMPLATAGYNLDDGVFLGGGFRYTHHAFRKEPYASRNSLVLGHALATSAWFLDYEGDFRQVAGKMDLLLNLEARAPRNTSNFFGAGNETVFEKEGEQPVQYYRTRYNLVEADARLQYPLGSKVKLFAGPAGQYFNMRREENE
ncbi:MAG TPA: hypothetical protein VD772_02015, partial [Anseongella sp.]|nr:hypothetical protein [Anseongella sp.]